jgi:hypothetical protein
MEQVSEREGIESVSNLDDVPHSPWRNVAAEFRYAIFLVIYLLLSGNAYAAPVLFDPANYASLAKSDSEETIKPGTQITLENWKQYKRFFPLGIQVLYSNQHIWHVGSTPDFTITVGPTIHYRWPRKDLEDTEKYGTQTRLLKTNAGTYGIKNYVSGLPFPIHAEPNLAYKVSYNLRYGPFPTVLWFPWTEFIVDRFLNVRITSEGHAEFYRLSHLSTPGLPTNPDYGKGYLLSTRSDVTAPEDVKYTSALTLQRDDPTALSEQYFYIPQIRRTLRYSTAGRCNYQFESDTSTRDFSYDLANVRANLLGEARILALMHLTEDPAVLYGLNGIHVKSSAPGWPKPDLGRWELRDVYVIEHQFLPDHPARKCFGRSVMYIDKENWQLLALEDYDTDGKLWKELLNLYMEVPENTKGGDYMIGHHTITLNFRENHASVITLAAPLKLDDEVPGEYRNAADSALPGSIMSINK